MRGKIRKLSSSELKYIKANINKRMDYKVAKVIGIHASQLCRIKERIVKEKYFNVDKEWKICYGN